MVIPKPNNKVLIKVKNGNTQQIMNEVLLCYTESNHQVKEFAKTLQGSNTYNTCKNVFNAIKNNVVYKIDPPGYQYIRTPSNLWHTKQGDCKSFSVFAASCLLHLGITPTFRFVSFDAADKTPTHVYVVANNGKIIIDAVLPEFNTEKPYKHKQDFKMTQIARVSGVNNSSKQQLINQLMFERNVEALASNGVLSAKRNAVYEKALKIVQNSSVAGFPTAGLNLANNPASASSLANTIKNTALSFLPGGAAVSTALNAGLKIAPDAIKALFSPAGVNSSFFETFKFLRFLDNSTNKWKSRAAQFKNWTPDQRLAWYFNEVNSQNDVQAWRDAFQYAELFGSGGKVSNDWDKLQHAPAQAWNDMLEARFFKGNNIFNGANQMEVRSREAVMIPVSKTVNYQPPQQLSTADNIISQANGTNQNNSGGSGTIVLLIGGAGLLYALTR